MNLRKISDFYSNRCAGNDGSIIICIQADMKAEEAKGLVTIKELNASTNFLSIFDADQRMNFKILQSNNIEF